MRLTRSPKSFVITAIPLFAVALLLQTIPAELGSKPVVKASESPVAKLRQLLVMSPDEQQAFLANKSEEERQEILATVDRYKALRADERELRLKATELRWY